MCEGTVLNQQFAMFSTSEMGLFLCIRSNSVMVELIRSDTPLEVALYKDGIMCKTRFAVQ